MYLEGLLAAHCAPVPSGTPPLGSEEVQAYLAELPGWELVDDGGRIRKRYRFGGFSAAVDFLVKLAPLANGEDHHPDVRLTMYRWMDIDYRTNSIGGLSRNDFIMAAKVDRLYEEFTQAK